MAEREPEYAAPTKVSVAVWGAGRLAAEITQSVGSCSSPLRAWPVADLFELTNDAGWAESGCRLLVTATDGWDRPDHQAIQQLCRAYELAWLPVYTELGRVVIGPWDAPGVPGCFSCAELRRRLADEHDWARQAVRQKYPQLAQASPWLTPLAARTVAAVTAIEVTRWVETPPDSRPSVVRHVDLNTLAASTRRFLPDPLCPDCAPQELDGADTARIVLQPRPKPAPDVYRISPVTAEHLNRLREVYVDEHSGLIRSVSRFPGGSLAVAAATMRSRWHDHTDLNWGRTLSYQTSETVAVFESLERHGGMAPGRRQELIRAPFADVSDHALDPRTLGLYPAEQYDQPGFPFVPFDVDRVCQWVWGHSFGRQEPILVPLTYAYYRAHATDPHDPSFAFEISNGCALGSCLEEAILYGLLEVIERDAFLLTWYACLPVPPIDLKSARDRTIPMLAAAIEADTGYRVLLFDTTMEHGIASVWAMAVGPSDTDGPALACAAGSHLEPERAANGALCELGPILADLIERYPQMADRSQHMAGNSALVTTMDDHSTLYANSAAASRLSFLADTGQTRTFADIRARNATTEALSNADLTDDLREMVRRLTNNGLDVVVVDQTTAEHRAGGVTCVKVIVPGLLPMTFGHQNRRVYGLRRLSDVPYRLGLRAQLLTSDDINPFPHPFP